MRNAKPLEPASAEGPSAAPRLVFAVPRGFCSWCTPAAMPSTPFQPDTPDAAWLSHALQRLTEVLSGAAVDDLNIIVPITDGRRMHPGSTAPVLTAGFTQLPGGLFVPGSTAGRPQPIDLMQVYLTFHELTGSPVAPSDLLNTLKQLSRNEVLTFTSSWICRMTAPGADTKALDREYMELLPSDLRTRASNLLTSGGRRLLAHQCFLVVSKLALTVCPEVGAGDVDPEALALLPLAVADQLGRSSSDPSQHKTVSAESITPLVQEIVSNQHFNSPNDPAHLVGRWVRQWRQLPEEHPVNECDPLEHLYTDLTGTNFDDLSAVVLGLWSQATTGKVVVPIDYFNSLAVRPDVLEATLRIISAPVGDLQAGIVADWERSGFEGLGWEFSTFGRFPVIRYYDGLLILDSKLLLQRVFGWPLFFDVESRLAPGRKRQGQFSNAVRHHAERYVLEVLEGLAPKTVATKRLYTETDLQAAYPGKGIKLVDAVIDYGDAWVVLDVTTRRLARPTVASVSTATLLDDIKKLVLKKAEQISSTIAQLRADEQALTGQPGTLSRSYLPVIAATEGFPVNPATTAIVNDVLQEAGLLGASDVLPLQVLDTVELEMVEGLAERGGPSLAALIQAKVTSGLARCALRDYTIAEARLAPQRPRRLDALWKLPFEDAAQRLEAAEAAASTD